MGEVDHDDDCGGRDPFANRGRRRLHRDGQGTRVVYLVVESWLGGFNASPRYPAFTSEAAARRWIKLAAARLSPALNAFDVIEVEMIGDE